MYRCQYIYGNAGQSIKELLAWVKAYQDKVMSGTGGLVAPSHVSTVYFQFFNGSKIQFVRSGDAAPLLRDLMAWPATQKRLADLGQKIPAREQQTPEGLAAHHKAEIDKWWPLIKAAGIKAD